MYILITGVGKRNAHLSVVFVITAQRSNRMCTAGPQRRRRGLLFIFALHLVLQSYLYRKKREKEKEKALSLSSSGRRHAGSFFTYKEGERLINWSELRRWAGLPVPSKPYGVCVRNPWKKN